MTTTISGSISPLLDSTYSTWTWNPSDDTYPMHMVYIREFSDDKTKAYIRTFDWSNSESLNSAKLIAGRGLVASLQRKNDGEVYLVASERLKSNFAKGRSYSVVYKDDDSETEICRPGGTLFLGAEEYVSFARDVKQYLVDYAKSKKSCTTI